MAGGQPIWRRSTVPPVGERVQTYQDSWRGTERVLRYQGRCVVCGRPTWAFDDGANDPRGPLGDNALWVTYTEDEHEHEVRTCSNCANTEASYRRALQIAQERGWRAVAPLGRRSDRPRD